RRRAGDEHGGGEDEVGWLGDPTGVAPLDDAREEEAPDPEPAEEPGPRQEPTHEPGPPPPDTGGEEEDEDDEVEPVHALLRAEVRKPVWATIRWSGRTAAPSTCQPRFSISRVSGSRKPCRARASRNWASCPIGGEEPRAEEGWA